MDFKTVIFVIIILQLNAQKGPKIQTDIGQFEGKLLDFGEKGQANVFYGLPFAKPPTRFEKPESPEYAENRMATSNKPACPQITNNEAFARMTSEDCLYLNLFKPAIGNNNESDNVQFPLIVFVHGGGYQAGTDLMHSLEYMAEQYVTKGVTYATIHYRMGITGLGSSGEEEFPGNYALWDVREALIWLRRNSKNLQIDPNRITLWGYSAGSSIVAHLSLSTKTRDLFSQTIQMSGSSINEWSYSDISVPSTKLVAEKLNCSTGLKECLRNRPYEELHGAVKVIENMGSFLNTNKFTPRFDGDFFEHDLHELLRTSPIKPAFASLTENEALLFVIYEVFNTTFYIPQSERPFFTIDKFSRILEDHILTVERFGHNVKEISTKILDFYFPKNENISDYKLVIQKYSEFISNILIVVPQMLEMQRKIELGWPVFQFKTTYNDNIKRNFGHLESQETTHAFEYPFLFGWPFLGDTNFTSSDLKFRDNLINAIVNFAKFGSPNEPNCNEYEQASEKNPFKYTDLSTEILTKDGLFEENVNFWNEITNDYGFDLMRGVKVGESEHLEL